MIAAIASSDGTRAGVTGQLFKVSVPTVLGTIKFNANGDVTSNPVTIYKVVGGKATTLRVIVPSKSIVASA
jgi:ABC-type branched-subunit amino acid transport system substrate-binding protein